MPTTSSTHTSRFTAGRVKRLLQTNDEVGHMAASVPVLVGHAAEHFLRDLSLQAAANAQQMGAATITASLLKYTVEHEERFRFLRPLFEQVPPVGDLESTRGAGHGDGRRRSKGTKTRSRTKRKAATVPPASRRRRRAAKVTESTVEHSSEVSRSRTERLEKVQVAPKLEASSIDTSAPTTVEQNSTSMELASDPVQPNATTVAPEARQILEEDYDDEDEAR
ncbi:hypothetical protein CCYA_CCYA01G0191 [Cyanidiococcus yangmingshanensis]|uniref:DR1-associated protein 1 (Negative cofactor 2 alpha) n=1 Tax=Cyanidiococcus yangmingshanensis TaxID=2690220 RepID=A0A7J7IRH6_9RHOD|nr:DR1-associated protein 1 (negative cofactor 2 alpha) [Cyanidiococcus yangmingshanensis]KAK4529334.1 hypothetical protein CCYA_CCYA01G0191 [Cyanidiococcus yangmingshanensis]